jgi:hypothetical protein
MYHIWGITILGYVVDLGWADTDNEAQDIADMCAFETGGTCYSHFIIIDLTQREYVAP